MHKLEEELIESYPLKPKIWLRYIDDVFFIWEHGLTEMNKWVTHLNNAHLSIKFTCEHSFKEIHFLDTRVKVDQSQSLYTVSLPYKSDSHNYLLYRSAHPKCTIESLPYSQFLRIRRICTKEADYLKHTNEIKSHFIRRGYPSKLLNKSIQTCLEKDRNALINPKVEKAKDTNTEDADKIFLINTFRPCPNSLPNLKKLGNIGKIKNHKIYIPQQTHDRIQTP